jgi:hypothetical protein
MGEEVVIGRVEQVSWLAGSESSKSNTEMDIPISGCSDFTIDVDVGRFSGQ